VLIDLVASTDKATHLDQGIAITSHASQGKTVDQVIASAPVSSFSQINQAAFYVTMSRARSVMHLFTDCKAALQAAVCRKSERLSPAEMEHEQARCDAQNIVAKERSEQQRRTLISFCIDLAKKASIKKQVKQPPPRWDIPIERERFEAPKERVGIGL
jgi:hypothetical protein